MRSVCGQAAYNCTRNGHRKSGLRFISSPSTQPTDHMSTAFAAYGARLRNRSDRYDDIQHTRVSMRSVESRGSGTSITNARLHALYCRWPSMISGARYHRVTTYLRRSRRGIDFGFTAYHTSCVFVLCIVTLNRECYSADACPYRRHLRTIPRRTAHDRERRNARLTL